MEGGITIAHADPAPEGDKPTLTPEDKSEGDARFTHSFPSLETSIIFLQNFCVEHRINDLFTSIKMKINKDFISKGQTSMLLSPLRLKISTVSQPPTQQKKKKKRSRLIDQFPPYIQVTQNATKYFSMSILNYSLHYKVQVC